MQGAQIRGYLNFTVNQIGLTDICQITYLTTAEDRFFSKCTWDVSLDRDKLSPKTRHNKFNVLQSSNIFFFEIRMKLKINRREERKTATMWKLSQIFLTGQ